MARRGSTWWGNDGPYDHSGAKEKLFAPITEKEVPNLKYAFTKSASANPAFDIVQTYQYLAMIWDTKTLGKPTSWLDYWQAGSKHGDKVKGHVITHGPSNFPIWRESRPPRAPRARDRRRNAAADGYTDASDKWLRRRLVPVRSRTIATAPISPNLMATLMPRAMMPSDCRKNHFYYRPSPDGTRILFGGRDGIIAGDPAWPATMLRDTLVGLFPELSETEITHSWFGQVAMNRDMVPRIFSRRGVRYAAGYCGSGTVRARWAGQKAPFQVLGESAGQSALDFRPPAAVPFFNGTPWFMPGVFAWMTLQDRVAAGRRARLAAKDSA